METIPAYQLRADAAVFRYKPNEAATEEWILAQGGNPGTRSTGDRVWFESEAHARYAVGGNRAGKTTKLILETGSFCMGFRPWYPPDHPWSRRGIPQRPTRNRYVVPNFGVHLPEVLASIRKWWPQEWWRLSTRDATGTMRSLVWITGSEWMFLSHKMPTEDFEGVECDLVAWDEPPPRDRFVAMERGLVSTGGRSIGGFTVLDSASWFNNEVVVPCMAGQDPDTLITWHSMWDNTADNGLLHATQQDILEGRVAGCPEQTAVNVRRYLSKIGDADERSAREHGTPYHLGGLVLSQLNDSHWRERPIPANAIILAALDPAGTRPFAGLHVAYWPDRELGWRGHVFDETWIPQTHNDLPRFCEIWKEKEAGETLPKHPLPSALTLIDPISEETQKADTYGRSLRQILFEDYEIKTEKANRANKRGRLQDLNGCIGIGHYTFSPVCRRLRQESKRWSWDPTRPKLTSGPDDVCDCLSYIHSADPGALLGVDATHSGILEPVWVPNEYRDREYRRDRLHELAAAAWADRREGILRRMRDGQP